MDHFCVHTGPMKCAYNPIKYPQFLTRHMPVASSCPQLASWPVAGWDECLVFLKSFSEKHVYMVFVVQHLC